MSLRRCRRVGAPAVLAVCVLAWFVAPQAAAFATPAWLFSVDMPVSGQTAAERTRVAREGLLKVLTRVTGLQSVPRNEVVQAALAAPDSYYTEFAFAAEPGSSPAALRLRINFQADAVLDLTRQARLPLWWTRRPRVLVWLALEENGVRSVVSASSEHPLRMALVDAARDRGLELFFPVMDLTDQLAVGPADVWGRVAESLDAAGQRYAPDVVVTARFKASLAALRGLDVRGDWQFWLGNDVYAGNQAERQYPRLAEATVNGLVDGLVERYAVPARLPQLWEFRVAGLDGIMPYATLMRYLAAQDFLDDVQLVALDGDVLTLQARTAAQGEQLLTLLTAETRLRRDHLHRGPVPQFRWSR